MNEEKIIIGENTRYPLNGLLTLPDDTAKPVPAVVFVHGSGASNMDEKVGKLTPFKDLARGLARHGIASVRYDKRSFAHGFKLLMDKSQDVTVKIETIDDAILATELLKKDPRIDSERVFIIGHSMGGMLAPRIDAEGGNYAGLIIMAGSPRKLEEIILDQNEAAMCSTKGFLNWIVKKQVAKFSAMFDGMYELSDAEAKKRRWAVAPPCTISRKWENTPRRDTCPYVKSRSLFCRARKTSKPQPKKILQRISSFWQEKRMLHSICTRI